MLKALAAAGNQIAVGELIRFVPKIGRSVMVTYVGTSSADAGSSNVTSIIARILLPSTGRSFDNAYAAGTSTASCTAHAPTATMTVLRKYCASSIWLHASPYASGCHCVGNGVGGVWASSAGSFIAPVIAQNSGKTKASRNNSMTTVKTDQYTALPRGERSCVGDTNVRISVAPCPGQPQVQAREDG